MNTENLTGISKILMNAACAVSKLSQESPAPLDADKIYETLSLFKDSLLEEQAYVVEKRPEILACDVVRFQNNKDKWVAFVGLLNGHPYEIFTGLQDDDEGILLPKTVTKGNIIKVVNPDGTKRYDFQFENKRGYKTTVEGLSYQPQDAFGLLDIMQIAAMQVFGQRQGSGVGVPLLPHQRRDAAPAEHLTGPPPAFPGDQAIAALRQRPHRNGVQQSAAVDALRQRRQLLLVEVPAGLVGAGGDLPDGQQLHRRLFFPVQKRHLLASSGSIIAGPAGLSSKTVRPMPPRLALSRHPPTPAPVEPRHPAGNPLDPARFLSHETLPQCFT